LSRITDIGVQSLALLTRQHLNLSGCHSITDAGFHSLAADGAFNIWMGWCYNITDDGLHSLAALASLQHLDLRSV
jgi:hypothetical protein